MSYYDYYWLDN